jgi:hypothetical protein
MALEAQNNPFTSILMVEAADPQTLPDADPAAGQRRLAVGTDHILYLVSDAGVKTAVGGAAGAPTTSQYIVGAADGGLSAEKVRTDLYKNYNPDSYPASPASENDEFDTGSVDAKWGWTTSPSVHNTSQYPGHLYISSISQSLSGVYFRQSYAPGASTAFCIVAKVSISAPADGTSRGVQIGLAALDSGDAEIKNIRIADSGTTTTMDQIRLLGTDGTVRTINDTPNGWHYIVLARDASNNWTGYWSRDGLAWVVVGASASSSTTVAKVGFRIEANNAAITHYYVADFFRRFATATPPFFIGA